MKIDLEPTTEAEIRLALAVVERADAGPLEIDDSGCIEAVSGGAVAYMAEHASMHTIAARGEDWSSADGNAFVLSRDPRVGHAWALRRVLELIEELQCAKEKGSVG